MASERRRPRWGQLYLILPLMGSLFWLESRLRLPNGGRHALDVGIIVLVCGLAGLWQHANALALAHLPDAETGPVATTVAGRLILEEPTAPASEGMVADGKDEADGPSHRNALTYAGDGDRRRDGQTI